MKYTVLLALWLMTSSVTATVAPLRVAKWATGEIVLQTARPYANPYTAVSVTAEFVGPKKQRKTVAGFWDGGSRFVIRFTPTDEGAWTYRTHSDDPGLNNKSGQITCKGVAPNAQGFVRQDAAHPYHFRYDDGQPYFMLGQTYYNWLGYPPSSAFFRASIDSCRAYGMNKIRMVINGGLTEVAATETTVFGLRPGSDSMNVGLFQKADSVVQYMLNRGMVADLILLPRAILGTKEQEHRFVRYLLARYGAYPNVIWCLINEWNYAKRPKEFYHEVGQLIRDEDPWATENGLVRLLSIHQRTRIDFEFFDQPNRRGGGLPTAWVSHAIVQLGVRNRQQAGVESEWTGEGKTAYRHGDAWGNASILYNRGHNRPVVNDEYGYIGEPNDVSEADTTPLTRTKHRQILWGIYTAGGYASAGDKTNYPGRGKPYQLGFWQPTAEYGDIRRLVNFFTQPGLQYQAMQPQNQLVKQGDRVYVLADSVRRQFVVYAATGGNIAIALPTGTYRVVRFDPATGNQQRLPDVTGGQAVAFALPNNDLVLYLIHQP
jgi:hypothetical protein